MSDWVSMWHEGLPGVDLIGREVELSDCVMHDDEVIKGSLIDCDGQLFIEADGDKTPVENYLFWRLGGQVNE